MFFLNWLARLDLHWSRLDLPWSKLAEILLSVLETIWTWPTVVVLTLVFYHREISDLLKRISSASKAKIGVFEFEVPVSPQAEAAMNAPLLLVEGVTYGDAAIELDGRHFQNCIFNGTTFIFRGRSGLRMSGCTLRNVAWQLEDAAAQTMTLLAGMRIGMGPNGPVMAQRLLDEWTEALTQAQED